MRFSEIVGHELLKRHLAMQIDSGRISHAQLFSGYAGYGTLPLAIAYVQYLFCEHRMGSDACGTCPSCMQVAQLSHPDLHIVFPVNKREKRAGEAVISDMFMDKWRALCIQKAGMFTAEEWYDQLDLGKTMKGMITAKESEEIIKKLALKSFAAEYKVMLIWLPEMMNQEAANKLLKILEEPWDKTLFILVSEHPELLLSTIVSRTQEITVPPIEAKVLAGVAEYGGFERDDALTMARLAGGSLIELEALIRGESDDTHKLYFELFSRLMRLCYANKHLELIEWVDEITTLTREKQRQFMLYAVRMLRESYIIHAGAGAISYLWGEEAEFCNRFAPYVGNQNIEALIVEIERAMRQIDQNGSPRIVFTHFALSVSKMITSIKE